MKKFFIAAAIFVLSFQNGFCELNTKDVNLYNLQRGNSYIINLESKAQKIDVSACQSVKVLPVTSLYQDGKQLFIEAIADGVCDVNVSTAENTYKIRFVTGPVFQENNDDILLVDIPFEMKNN